MSRRESPKAAKARWDKLHLVQDHYSEFLPFLVRVMDLLGFTVSEIQADMAKFIAYGPLWLMAQAQRGQAKTTITAAYAVWAIIQNPRFRVLIVSAGGSQASDISTLIIRIIMNLEELECLRPDKLAGDRSSVEHFDVHYTLKGVDKSPSVKCLGITSNMQGNRADLLIADDVESLKNSKTALMREQLRQLTLDFTSICTTGRIVWLGTPQTEDSIYSTLPGRGVSVRVWPGRYPTEKQLEVYGDTLAPLLLRRIQADPTLQTGGGALGDQGKAIEEGTTPGWLDEQNLQNKEEDQGTSWFQLQHMLNTRLSDEERRPLKLGNLIVADVGHNVPLTIDRSIDPKDTLPYTIEGFGFSLRRPGKVSPENSPMQGRIVYVDPAAKLPLAA